MKVRSLKLHEAHKGIGSVCSVLWDGDGKHLVTSSSAGPTVFIHDASKLWKPALKELRHHKDGVTAISFSPDFATLASCSVDQSVKLYSFPDGEFQSNVTRFTMPIRSLAFNKSGSLLAAGGFDDGIKLIATVDSTISKVLKGHRGSVTGLAFDPKNEYLASVDGFGTVIFWELSSGKQLHTLRDVAPNCDMDSSLIHMLSWSPNGDLLAVPGLKNDVVMYDRDTAKKMFTLKGDHESSICFLSWSPNGKYIATSGLDKQVLIWDVDLRQDIERQKFEDMVSSLAWKPNGNALAVIDVMGKIGIWDSPVPPSMKSPMDGVLDVQTKNKNGHLLFDEDEESPSHSGSLEGVYEKSNSEPAPSSRKRLRKSYIAPENSDEESEGEDDLLRQIESRKRTSARSRKHVGLLKEDSSGFSRSKMQEAFQPGSTPAQAGKRRFLVYNMLGSITTFENEGYSHIEVDFHDTGRGPRVPAMTDYFGFTMAALSENGGVFANPCKGEKNMSTLMYRPFSSWANNSEWSMRFEGEEVKAVALGTGWVAAVTSLNFLRIYTEGGLQRHILSLQGPVVTTAGYKDQLAIVTHSSECLPSGDQMLDVKVLNILKGTQLIECRLPLSPASCLTWFGFSEEGQLCSYDSMGVLRVFCHQFGGSWLPVFSAAKAKKSDEENHWVVGLNASKVFCIVCKTPESYPMVTPRPVLELFNLAFPLASSDLGAADLENEFIQSNLHLSQVQNKIGALAAAGQDTDALEDEVFNTEAAIDRCILRLIASCCYGDKLVRATELAQMLSLEKSVKGAIKLVTALKLPMLAERFSSILEERLLNESKVKVAVPSVIPSAMTNDVPLHRPSPSSDISRTVEPATPVPHPHFSNKETTEETAKMAGTKRSLTCDEALKLLAGRTEQPRNPFAKQKDDDTNKEGREPDVICGTTERTNKDVNMNASDNSTENPGNAEKCQRPANPFAKTTKNEEKYSLLDSMRKMRKRRKMKKADMEKDERAAANKRVKA